MGIILLVSLLVKFQSSLNVLGASSSFIKHSYSIAIFGDSMVDTMGEQLDYLQIALKKRYPHTTFYYYNYGIGSQNAEEGLARFHSPFHYKTRNFVPLSDLHPDIIIVGSFAYNPFSPYNRDRHWVTLSKLVKEAQATGADVYMLAEIAPLRSGFGNGPHGVNWPNQKANEWATHIVEQLENAVYLSRDHLKVPLINVYAATQIDGRFGAKKYVDPNDGIHPSVAGHQLMSEVIASKIKLH